MSRKGIFVAALAGSVMLAVVALAWGAIRTDPIIAASAVDADYHTEGQIIAGNIHVNTDRAPDDGIALTTCDPDPRPEPHTRPACTWGTPQGIGDDFLNFGRHIPDGDSSPNGAFTPQTTDSRDNFNGKVGFNDGGIFEGHFFDDDDMHFRLTPRTVDAYLAPEGNANNRWRRVCGTGVVEQFNNQGTGGAEEHPALPPFAPGQIRKFVMQVWDADHRDPSDNDGGNQDFFIIDILRVGSLFDTSRCLEPDQRPPNPPVNPQNPNQPNNPRPVTATGGSQPAIIVAGASAPSLRVAAGLRGPRACVSRAFTAAVGGTNIARVDFLLNGRRVARVTRRDASGAFRARMLLRRGSSRGTVTARVVFRNGTNARARNLRLAVRRCARAQQRPSFTG